MNMKTFAALTAVTLLSPYMTQEASAASSNIPSNVSAIYPAPDQRVNLAFNAYSRGLQQISILFNNDITVNSSCQEEACIYMEGNDTPVQTVGISGVTVDHMQANMGGVMFGNSCTANGNYRVTIPAGFWIIQGGGYSEPMELFYEILVPQRLWPNEQVTKEISEFRLEFPDYQEAKLLDAKKIEFYRTTAAEAYPLLIQEGKNDDGSKANFIQIQLLTPVTEQGDYYLFVQADAAAGVNYTGENKEQPSTLDPNIEEVYPFTISKLDAPEILPKEGPVESFVPFELTVPGTPDFWFVNDKAASFIYPVDENGNILPDASYRLTAKKDFETDKIILTIIEDGQATASVIPEEGSYALKLASGLFSGSWDGEFINSAPFVYYYKIVYTTNGVKVIPAGEIQEVGKGVFSIDGRKIQDAGSNANATLPEGLYIIDGQKKLIRNR